MPSQAASVLIADDSKTNRFLLDAFMKKSGFITHQAEDGEQAINVYLQEKPDIILMDVMMPVLDGYKSAKKIKSLAHPNFIPIIFITAMTDDDALAKCIECGGDDFLTKPYNRVIIESKMRSMLRIRDLHLNLEKKNQALQKHQLQLAEEQNTAQVLFEKVLQTESHNLPNLQYHMSPHSLFNGDVLLVSNTPTGSIQIFLGDFTGHGLPAAVGTLPLSDIFYKMSRKGFSISDIIPEINEKLFTILPPGVFCAGCMLDINPDENMLSAWCGGLPEVIVYNKQTKEITEKIASTSLPLGVVDNHRLKSKSSIHHIDSDTILYLYTDGVTEAKNNQDEMFGEERLEKCLSLASSHKNVFPSILSNLDKFTGKSEQSDDITLVEVSCDFTLDSVLSTTAETGKQALVPGVWSMELQLDPVTLRNFDPRPLVTQIIVECQLLLAHREEIHIIITELLTNAIDHGLLGLDSSIKTGPEGFLEYFSLQEKGLNELKDGWIKINLEHTKRDNGGELRIMIEDTGKGFDTHKLATNNSTQPAQSGRGISLIQSLCHDITYHPPGNRVEAVYRWSNQ